MVFSKVKLLFNKHTLERNVKVTARHLFKAQSSYILEKSYFKAFILFND